MTRFVSALVLLISASYFVVSAVQFFRFGFSREPFAEGFWTAIVHAVLMTIASALCYYKADDLRFVTRAVLVSSLLGGCVPFLYAFKSIITHILHQPANLSDGEVWWGDWFAPSAVL